LRDHPLRVLNLGGASWLGLGLCLLAASAGSRAQPPQPAPPPVKMQLAPEQELRAGSHASVSVDVELPPGNDSPLLLTPSVEGSSVEVVRGRLSRSDGKARSEHVLRFEIPVLARTEGTAILRVELMTYVCARTCQRLLLNASQIIRVR
jgi:hypothetical protein